MVSAGPTQGIADTAAASWIQIAKERLILMVVVVVGDSVKTKVGCQIMPADRFQLLTPNRTARRTYWLI
jgi:hypothetical protein